jgi:periplasmic divalent cation tolerance protein
MSDFIQVTTAVDNAEDAGIIASALVSQRLAACVQVMGPLRSTYWWDGDIQVNEEWLCIAKSRADLFEELSALVHQVHPYDVPELLATPVIGGGKAYLDWLNGELKQEKHEEIATLS